MISGFRILLLAIGFHYSFLWGITSASDLWSYLYILLVFLLILFIFQISLLTRYSQSKAGGLIVGSFFIAFPGLLILYYLKPIIGFFTGFAHMKENVDYDVGQIAAMGISDQMAGTITYVLYGLIIIVLFVLIAYSLKRCKQGFVRGGAVC